MIVTSLFRNLTKVSTSNFRIDINGIFDPFEMCKNIICALFFIYQPIRKFIPCSPEVHYTGLTSNNLDLRRSSSVQCYMNLKALIDGSIDCIFNKKNQTLNTFELLSIRLGSQLYGLVFQTFLLPVACNAKNPTQITVCFPILPS